MCNNTGIQLPVPLPGFWREIGGPEVVQVDPYFQKHKVYKCNPPEICLGP